MNVNLNSKTEFRASTNTNFMFKVIRQKQWRKRIFSSFLNIINHLPNNTRVILAPSADADWAGYKTTHKAKSQVIITPLVPPTRWKRGGTQRLSASLLRQRFRRSSQVLISEFQEASASFEMCHKKATAVTRASIFIYTCIRASFAKNRFWLCFARFSHTSQRKYENFRYRGDGMH